jgi:RHS repeat-associated protein
MWRPRLTHEYDSANTAATSRYNAWTYDGNGRTTFAAYPLASASSVASFTQGVWSDYDPLGRVTSVAQDSELGSLIAMTEYLPGFLVKTTNPRGKATTTSFLTWDQPDTSMPLSIQAPAGVTTTIARDTFGRSQQVSRSGTWAGAAISANRYYRYNPRGQLERSLTSEERATYFDYDAAGNIEHTYHCNHTSDVSCNWEAVPGARPSDRTTMTYDPMNRVTLVDYPTGTDDIATTYQADGAVDTIVMGIVTLDYAYNKRRLLTEERLLWNANNLITGYGYNANGHPATLTYRDGHQVSFAPNALGQATQAGTYATGASYFPNGALKQFTYGNGIVHTLTQNARQLPERSRDMFGTTAILDDTYDYDQNGSVAGISDGLAGQPGNRDMTYDDLDRLVGVTASSAQGGNAVFAYDVLDNIRQLDQGTRTVRHSYDSVNRLDTIKNAAGATLSSYDFDTRGNLSQRTTGAVVDTFTFDKANRLLATNINGVASTYRYDGLGRRMQQIEGSATSYFQYSQAGALLTSQDPTTRTNHIHLAGSLVAERKVLLSSGTTSIRYQHTDALCSPVAETSETGALLQRERMTAYGEPADGAWTAGPGFTGHQMDASSKLVYMQQRYYDPVGGRFLSVDPVTTNPNTGASFNRYSYAANNPYKFTDPDGRQEMAAERFSNSYGSWTPEERAPFEAVAVPVTTAIVAATPVVGPYLGLALRQAAKKDAPAASPAASGSLKNPSGPIEASANAARSNPYPREVSGHANQRLQTRDSAVTPASMEAAAVSGKRTLDPATGKTRHDLAASASPTGRGVTVVTNPAGKVVTVIDKGTKFNPKH